MLGLLLLGFRNWGSSETPDFVGIEAVIGDGCLGGLEEEGFCFEADAIVTVWRIRESERTERRRKESSEIVS